MVIPFSHLSDGKDTQLRPPKEISPLKPTVPDTTAEEAALEVTDKPMPLLDVQHLKGDGTTTPKLSSDHRSPTKTTNKYRLLKQQS